MENKEIKYKYELTDGVVNYILNALNRNQIAGVQQAKDLLSVIELLQKPLNASELEKESYEKLKEKFDDKKTK